MSVTILQLILTISVNPFNLPLMSVKFIAINSILTIMVPIGIYLIWKNSLNLEKYIVIFILAFLINILELKEDMFAYWPKNSFFTYGTIFQFVFLSMPLTKVSWKYNAIASIILIALLLSRYFDYEENSNSKYFSMTTFVLNFFVATFSSLILERYERSHFLENKKFKRTQKRLKNMIIDVLPSAALIVKKGKIIFTNQKVEKMFNKVIYEEILNETKKIRIKANSVNQKEFQFNENMSMREFLAENNNQKTEKNELICNSELQEEEISLFNIIDLTSHSEFKKYFGTYTRTEFNKETITYLDISVSKIFWDDGDGLFLFLHENEIANKLNELDRKTKYKDKLLATVSHDLRTPLNGILGMLKLALLTIKDELVKESLLIAERSAHLLLNMINDLLDMSQISSGTLRLNIKKFSIIELIEEVSQIISFQAKYKGLEFSIVKNIEVTNPYLYSDPNRLKQIILNLLGNALKFTDKGFIKISVNPFIPNNPKSENIECFEKKEFSLERIFLIKVEDSGNGIKKEDIPKLFKLFGKLETEENNKVNQTGVGLGLSLSQNLVQLLNKNKPKYEISVTSEFGRGSCFSFPLMSLHEEMKEEDNIYETPSFGVIPNFPQPADKMLESFYVVKNKKNKIRILVVEDDPINMMVVTAFLKFYDDLVFDVTHNGREAFESITQMASLGVDYDLILMDCNMPIMDGFQASRMILEFISQGDRQPLVIVAMTANVSPIDYENCFKAGMKDYISKPFTREKLREIIIKHASNNK